MTFGTAIRQMTTRLRSPEAQSKRLASFAKREIARVKRENEAALERKLTPPRITVDGRKNAPLQSVKPSGTIVAEFNLNIVAVQWILSELHKVSPVLSGEYERSHIVLADGVEIDAAKLPKASEFIIVSVSPYARKIEGIAGRKPLSDQAPDGVYEAVAVVARNRFKQEAAVKFTFQEVRTSEGESQRQPAIVVRPY